MNRNVLELAYISCIPGIILNLPDALDDERDADEGYAWSIVCARSVLCSVRTDLLIIIAYFRYCFVFSFWYVSQACIWGVIQLRLTRDGLAPAATFAFIGSIQLGYCSS